jgi:hypothetical protein
MRRSKRKAVAFLTGAILIGGMTGAAGNAWYSQYQRSHSPFRGPGERFFDDLGLSCEQRVRMDSILHATDVRARAVNAPLRPKADSLRAAAAALLAQGQPAIDSVRSAGHTALLAVLTPSQRQRYDRLMADVE